MEGYAVVFAIAALTTLLLTPLVRRLAVRAGAIVQPNPRGIHTKAVPTLGGAAMFVGFLVAMGAASRIPQFHEMFENSTDPAGVMLGAAVMFAVGASIVNRVQKWWTELTNPNSRPVSPKGPNIPPMRPQRPPCSG